MSRRQIEQGEILDALAFRIRSSSYHCMPGVVTTYYPAEQTADVQPAVHDVRVDPDSGARVSEPWPIIARVPVTFPRFGGFAVYGPLAPGDKVLLVAQDLDPTMHKLTGKAEDPIDTRRHGGGYWSAIPGDITDGGRMPDTAGAMVIGKPGGPMVQITGTTISLGAANATDFAALASKVDAALTAILGKFNAHTHVTACPAGSGTAAFPIVALQIVPAGPTGSTKVKVAP